MAELVERPFQWTETRLLPYGPFHFSTLFEAISEDGKSFVLRKVRFKDLKDLQTCQAEVEKIKTLSHPNLVKHLGTTLVVDELHIFLEYFGQSLALKAPLPERVIRKYTKQLLQGLDHLHKNGIVHGSLKAGNVLVDEHGHIKLADFSASKQLVYWVGEDVRCYKYIVYWLSPEIISEAWEPCLSNDIWRVGCTIIEMATGHPPWSEKSLKAGHALRRIMDTLCDEEVKRPPIPKDLSEKAKNFLFRCFESESRRPSAADLLEDPFIKDEWETPLALNFNSSDEFVPLSGGSSEAGVTKDDSLYGSSSEEAED